MVNVVAEQMALAGGDEGEDEGLRLVSQQGRLLSSQDRMPTACPPHVHKADASRDGSARLTDVSTAVPRELWQ